jgi:ribosomal protein L12E/L44/L45/RPP1/RPP2
MSLKYTAAYLLNVVAGLEHPTEEDVKKVLKGAGCKVDENDLKTLFAQTKGKNAHELIKKGLTGLAAASAGASASAVKAPMSPKRSPKAGPKSPKKAAKEEEEDADMGFSLFD